MESIASIDPFADDDETPLPSSGPVSPPAPSDDTYLDAVFGATGLLARRFDGYQPRPGQIALARQVDLAIKGSSHAFAEGPTGTGKSVAYAVPATYHAATHGRRVVIVTANIALTEQLAQKDLPLLQEILPWSFSFALMKGKANYLCIDKLLELEAEKYSGGAYLPSPGSMDAEQMQVLEDWARDTATGDVSELPFVPEAQLWRRFSKSSDECKGKNCKSYQDCYAYKAKRTARRSHVVVTNYHMLFAAMLVRRLTDKNVILPGYDVAVLDEAHKAAEIARSFFGFEVTAERCRRPSRQLDKLKNDRGAADLSKRLQGASYGFFGELVEYKKRGGYKVRLKEHLAGDEQVARAWKYLDESLDQAAAMLRQVASGQMTGDARADWSKASERAAETRICLEMGMQLEDENEQVYYLEEGRDGRGEAKLTLGMRPIRVADRLRDELFNGIPRGAEKPRSTYMADDDDEPDEDERREAGLRAKRSVIVTSATLAVNGGFAYVADEMGAPEGSYTELVAESPFDWARRALLIVPSGMPDPSSEREAFGRAVPEVVVAAVQLAGGRTLCLFTSYAALNKAYDALKAAKCPYRLLKQGDMPRTKLVNEFRRDTNSVLLGTESMWAGVDVPGSSLSCVVIDKIPFPTPDDPVLDALFARDKKAFFNHSVPRAIIQFKQGFGRLIRSVDDVGVVVCCDPRLIDKPYGKQFLRSLPEVQRSRTIEHIQAFLPAEPGATTSFFEETTMGIGEALDMHDELKQKADDRHRRREACGPVVDMVFIDLETSGLDANESEIVEVAAMRVDALTLEHKGEFHAFVLPTKPVPFEVARLNGYDEETWVEGRAVPLAVALAGLNPLLEGACQAGQNPDFDRRFLEAGARSTGIQLAKFGSYRQIDVGTLAWPLVLAGLLPTTGLDLSTQFFRVPGAAHRAMGDVRRAIGVYTWLVSAYTELAERSWGHLEFPWCANCKKRRVGTTGNRCDSCSPIGAT